jgi:hypothetical protein
MGILAEFLSEASKKEWKCTQCDRQARFVTVSEKMKLDSTETTFAGSCFEHKKLHSIPFLEFLLLVQKYSRPKRKRLQQSRNRNSMKERKGDLTMGKKSAKGGKSKPKGSK